MDEETATKESSNSNKEVDFKEENKEEKENNKNTDALAASGKINLCREVSNPKSYRKALPATFYPLL